MKLKDLKENKHDFVSLVSVTTALILVISSVAYIVYKTVSNKAHDEKWKDYDECGMS